MKRIIPISLLVIALLFGADISPIQAQAPLSVNGPKLMDVVPGVLYLRLKPNHGIDFTNLSPTHTGNAALDGIFAQIGVTEVVPFNPDPINDPSPMPRGMERMYVIHFSEEQGSPRIIGHDFSKLDVVEGVSPRFIFEHCSYTPNDPQVPNQYSLDNAHMHILDAWGVSKGNSNIVIADLDEGANYNHEDLAANIFKIGNNFGYDIVGDNGTSQKFKPDNDPMPGPNQSHGTFTTGCMGMVPDNGKGGAGSGFNCKIMVIKIADNLGKLYGGYEGITYAWMHGAKILNCSWGGYESDQTYLDFVQVFIDSALANGALVVAAAGNDTKNIDNAATHFIPAYSKNVLSVGATDASDKPATFSNFGKTVNVYAPGDNILSTTFPGNSAYDYSSGTSFACPLTAGVAGLVLAKNPDWTPKFITRQIIETCDNVVNPTSRTFYWGRVNAYKALTAQTVPGVGITTYKVDGIVKGGLKFVDKIYTIDVTFKNYMAAVKSGGNIQVQLLPIDGSVTLLGGYTVLLGPASLGAMISGQQAVGSFKFSRDGTDGGAGTQLPLYFAVSYGSATVEGSKYYDTLVINVDIISDDIFATKGVTDQTSNILELGNTYPNPVANDATINFELASREYAKLSICDILGREVSILSDGMMGAGKHSVNLNAHTLENGVYIYKLETSDGAIMTKRMIVIH